MNVLPEPTESTLHRRRYLASSGTALLGAAAMAALPTECFADKDDDRNAEEILYGHGTVWNRNLLGVAAALNLSFDLRVNLSAGTGAGSAYDPVYSESNIHFTIASAAKKKVRGGENQFTMKGVVTDANTPELIGLPVRILAETRNETTAIAIAIGDLAFAGAGVVTLEYLVLGILLILIGGVKR